MISEAGSLFGMPTALSEYSSKDRLGIPVTHLIHHRLSDTSTTCFQQSRDYRCSARGCEMSASPIWTSKARDVPFNIKPEPINRKSALHYSRTASIFHVDLFSHGSLSFLFNSCSYCYTSLTVGTTQTVRIHGPILPFQSFFQFLITALLQASWLNYVYM